jgi:H+-transporting ATPase
LGQLLTLSVVLGSLLCGSSFAHFFIARDVFKVSREQLDTILYLQMSSCPHFVIFSTRLATYFWENAPSLLFFIAIVGTQIFALYISVYGLIAHPIGWGWGASVFCISVGYFIFLDIVKVQVYRVWSFELTATLWPVRSRREKLARRRAAAARLARIRITINKLRKVLNATRFAAKLKHYKKLPEPEPVPPPAHHH